MRPKSARKWGTLRALQLALCTLWPTLLIWMLVTGPSKTPGTAHIRQTITETETLERLGAHSGGGWSRAAALRAQPELRLGKRGSTDSRGGSSGGGSSGGGGGGLTKQQARAAVEEVLSKVEGGGKEGKGGKGGAMAPEQLQRVTSSLKVYASANSKGDPDKYYYSFRNVRLTKAKMQFFTPTGFKPPVQPNWVDIVTGNASTADPPTMLVIKGEEKAVKWFHMPVKYIPSKTTLAACRGWVDKPAYLLQVRYSYNIWHTWNEGLMGLFQTLREQGALPLVQVDGEGNMREVTEGMGRAPCPLAVDPATNATAPEPACVPKSGVVAERLCDPKNQRWCRPGVWSYSRQDGPVIVPYTTHSVMNQWAQIYSVISEDVRDWSLVDGWCFRNLIVGKSSTLNFYQAINTSVAPEEVVEERAEAMSVFKAFVRTAQQEWVLEESGRKPWIAKYKGYADPALERLRKGIGPENITLVDLVVPSEVPGLVVEEAETLHRLWLKKQKKQKEKESEAALTKAMEKLDKAAAAGETAPVLRVGAGAGGVVLAGEEPALFSLPAAAGGGAGTGERAGPTAGAAAGATGGAVGGAAAEQQGQQQGQAGEQGLRRRRGLAEAGPQQQDGALYAEQQQGAADGSQALQLGEQVGTADLGVSGGEAAGAATAGAAAASDGSSEAGVDPAAAAFADAAASAEEAAEGSQEGAAALTAAAAVGEEEPAEPVEPAEVDREAALRNMPPVVPKAKLPHEQPRPLVTYMARNFFSRRLLNDHDVLRYVLSRYNVTLRVTTFEEPLQEVMELMGRTDVLIGMHGAGWTNALFIKHGATALQLYPYGWQLPDGTAIRGHNYQEIVLANKCRYLQWFNPHAHFAFQRREDFSRKTREAQFRLHFDPKEPTPTDGWPGNRWVYQNTYADMASLGPVIDEAMAAAGIPPMAQPLPRQGPALQSTEPLWAVQQRVLARGGG